ncbi:MAG: heavy metal-associated domain-containing protein [Bulleidia sp.]|nr:heavy metal-associated domain-containing protein [Bulleidia sp.]
MQKVTVKVDGMMCGMCEAHIQDTIRNTVPDAAKVKADRKKKTAVFLTDNVPEEKVIRRAINKTGYTYVGMSVEEAQEKKGFSLFH